MNNPVLTRVLFLNFPNLGLFALKTRDRFHLLNSLEQIILLVLTKQLFSIHFYKPILLAIHQIATDYSMSYKFHNFAKNNNLYKIKTYSYSTIGIFLFVILIFQLNAQPNKAYLINDEVEGLQIKIDMIRNAKKEVSLAYYAIYEDESGCRVLAAAVEAARRGVTVKIMIESMASKLSKPLLEYLCTENIVVEYFNQFRWSKMFKNLTSLHDKLLIVDNKYFITGGRNITNNYYSSLYASKKRFTDLEIFVEGPIASETTDYFNHIWNAPFTSFLNNKYKNKNAKKRKIINDKINTIIKNEKTNNIEYWTNQCTEIQEISFIRDYYHYLPRTRFVTNKILSLIYEADETIKIESPYTAPPRMMRRALRSSAQKGTKIRIVSNAAFATDVLLAAAVFDKDRKKYLKWGVRVYEYEGPNTLHSKTMVIDDKISVIGTYNLDQLSYSLNSETIIVIEDSTFTTKLTKILDQRILNCKPIFTTENPKATRNLNWKQKINFAFMKKTSLFSRPFL